MVLFVIYLINNTHNVNIMTEVNEGIYYKVEPTDSLRKMHNFTVMLLLKPSEIMLGYVFILALLDKNSK